MRSSASPVIDTSMFNHMQDETDISENECFGCAVSRGGKRPALSAARLGVFCGLGIIVLDQIQKRYGASR